MRKKKTIPNENFSQPCQPLENLDSRRNKRRLKSHRKTQKDLVKVSQSSGEGKKERKEEENKQKKQNNRREPGKWTQKKGKKNVIDALVRTILARIRLRSRLFTGPRWSAPRLLAPRPAVGRAISPIC